MPLTMKGGGEAAIMESGSGFFLLNTLILDISGSAKVLIGGCCDNR